MHSITLRRGIGIPVILFLTLLILALPGPAQAATCSDIRPDAFLNDGPNQGTSAYETYGPVCVVQDFDQGQLDYYTTSESLCLSTPGYIAWNKDRGAGYNLCIFEIPSDSESGSADSYEEPEPSGSGSDTVGSPTGSETAAAGSSSSSGSDYFTLRVCNQTSDLVDVAFIGRMDATSSVFTVKGWWQVPAFECSDIAQMARSVFYVYASSGTSEWSGNDTEVCVGSWAYTRSNVGDYDYTCASGEELRGFYEKTVSDDAAAFEWTLTN